MASSSSHQCSWSQLHSDLLISISSNLTNIIDYIYITDIIDYIVLLRLLLTALAAKPSSLPNQLPCLFLSHDSYSPSRKFFDLSTFPHHPTSPRNPPPSLISSLTGSSFGFLTLLDPDSNSAISLSLIPFSTLSSVSHSPPPPMLTTIRAATTTTVELRVEVGGVGDVALVLAEVELGANLEGELVEGRDG